LYGISVRAQKKGIGSTRTDLRADDRCITEVPADGHEATHVREVVVGGAKVSLIEIESARLDGGRVGKGEYVEGLGVAGVAEFEIEVECAGGVLDDFFVDEEHGDGRGNWVSRALRVDGESFGGDGRSLEGGVGGREGGEAEGWRGKEEKGEWGSKSQTHDCSP
jgi:hypothetical protein